MNSERLAGSVRIQELAIMSFEALARTFRELIEAVLDNLKSGIKFGRCWSAHVVEKVTAPCVCRPVAS